MTDADKRREESLRERLKEERFALLRCDDGYMIYDLPMGYATNGFEDLDDVEDWIGDNWEEACDG